MSASLHRFMKLLESSLTEANDWDKQIDLSSKEVVSNIEEVFGDIANEYKKYEVTQSSHRAAPDSTKFRAVVDGTISSGPRNIPTQWGTSKSYPQFLKVGTGIDLTIRKEIYETVMADLNDVFYEYIIQQADEPFRFGATYTTTDGKSFSIHQESGSSWGGIGINWR